MGDDWDDGISWDNKDSGDQNSGNVGVGKSFGKGRGFTPNVPEQSSWNNGDRRGRGGRGGGRDRGGGGYNRSYGNNDNDWPSNQNNGNDGDDWGSGGGGGYSGERRGRGGRGGGGGRFNRDDTDGGRPRNDDDSWGGGGSSNDWGSGNGGQDSYGERRGRGGGRGGRGGRGGGNFNRDSNNDDWGGSRGGGGRSDSNNDGWGGSRGGGGRSDSNNDDWGSGGGSKSRGGGGGGGWDNGGDADGEDGEKKEERPPIYLPKDISEEDLMQDQGISRGINFDDYDKINVNVTGDCPPRPINSFREAGLRDILIENLQHFRYDKPTPVQKYAIPAVLEGRDIMGCAQTGSGKTAAFLVPIINSLLQRQDELRDSGETCEPKAVILSPTRELTTQIYTEARKFCKGSIIKTAQIYGGTAVRYQNERMAGCHILVATPGRLNDFLNKRWLQFTGVKFIVLDEADRMLDMGFKDTISGFLNHETLGPREKRQTLMFSATFSEDIQRLAANFLNNYVFLAVGIVGSACKDVQQVILEADRKDKKKKLLELLQQQGNLRGTLVFVETKRNADFIATFLSEKSFGSTSIHGDRHQEQREEALREFKCGKRDILVATSVAARGLDIKGVTHVVNYDMPKDIDEYVHRIGRTGRLGNKGKATSFYDSNDDSNMADKLVKILKQAGQEIPSFLSDAGANAGYYEANEFGATDYREGNSFRTGDRNVPVAIAEEEDW